MTIKQHTKVWKVNVIFRLINDSIILKDDFYSVYFFRYFFFIFTYIAG